jgi:murein L,D-transpeptidase YafK
MHLYNTGTQQQMMKNMVLSQPLIVKLQSFFFCSVAITIFLFLALTLPTAGYTASPPVTPRAQALMHSTRTRIEQDLQKSGFHLGAPVFVRIFKIPGTLEVWLDRNGHFQLFKKYSICSYSGYPGPKLMEGDWQSPEGFYTVSARQMNPNSSYHLAFNVGYPNDFDRARKRTGSSIMVHGECSSRGCFAMGNKQMEEIYLLAHAALSAGQKEFSLHIFPFRLTARNLFKFRSSPWIGFWKKLRPGYDYFEQFHTTPVVTVVDGNYHIQGAPFKVAMLSNRKDGKQ